LFTTILIVDGSLLKSQLISGIYQVKGGERKNNLLTGASREMAQRVLEQPQTGDVSDSFFEETRGQDSDADYMCPHPILRSACFLAEQYLYLFFLFGSPVYCLREGLLFRAFGYFFLCSMLVLALQHLRVLLAVFD